MSISRNRVNPEPPANAGRGGRRYGGVDSEERQRQRRAKLVDAALVVFGNQGYHEATVRDVCKQAGLTSRYFYESFDSMEALYSAVFHAVNRDLMQAVVMALAQCEPDPEKLSGASLRAFLEFVRADPLRARVGLVDVFGVAGGGTHRLVDQAHNDFALLISGFVRQMFPRIDETAINIDVIAKGLTGANSRITTDWVNERCKTPLEDVLANMLWIYSACLAQARQAHDALPPKKPGT
jgi:AcrR family transcriptional regulator